MEEKCVLALLLKRLWVESKLRTDQVISSPFVYFQMRVAAELIIRPMYGNFVRFSARKYGEYKA